MVQDTAVVVEPVVGAGVEDVAPALEGSAPVAEPQASEQNGKETNFYHLYYNNMLFLGLKPISTMVLTQGIAMLHIYVLNVVLTQGNAMLLICVLNEVHNTTDVVIQYYIVFIIYILVLNVHLSSYYQTIRGQVLMLSRAVAGILDGIDLVESEDST